MDELNEGDEVEITYRLSGRKWQRDSSSEVKYFLNAEALSFRVLNRSEGETPQSPNDAFAEAAEDDAPF